jgi:hypothetical protein
MQIQNSNIKIKNDLKKFEIIHKDKRGINAVVKFLGSVPTTIGAWMMLFSKSAQKDDLKRLLINKLRGIQQQIGIPVGDGPFDIYFKEW